MNTEMDEKLREVFLNRLKELIGEGSARKFALKAGINETTFRGILNGSLPRLDTLMLIAKAGSKNLSWLVGEIEEKEAWMLAEDAATYLVSNDEFVQISFYKDDISAGHGNAVNYEKFKPLIFRRDWRGFNGLNPDNLLGAYVPGDSMEPLIGAGSDILFDTTKTHIEDGKIYVFNAGGDLLVKKMEVGFDHYIAKSLNKNGDYKDRVIGKDEIESLNIIGKAEITLPYRKL